MPPEAAGKDIRLSEELRDELGRRAIVKLFRRHDLLDLPGIKDRDPV